MIKEGIRAFRDKRVLLLQGPVGPFFRRLAEDLTRSGAKVFKVNFNGGDWMFSPREDSFNFRGWPQEWPAYFEALIDRLNIDVVMLFGDCRPMHGAAIHIAQEHGLEIGVFEEGYIRPDYVTLERFGVNGHSRIPRNPIFHLNGHITPNEDAMPVRNTFWHVMMWAILYYIAAGLLKPFFRHYHHHRPLTVLEALPWIRSAWRKWYYRIRERGMTARLTGKLSRRFFLVPLQVHNDAQVHFHSDYDSVEDFIAEVIRSFAEHAPRNTALVFKHHPVDRGYNDYSRVISRLSLQHGLQNRCFYIHDQHLPTLLKHTRGVIVINSTVGLSALYHGAPVKVCGRALYDIEGLTYKGTLSLFWRVAHASLPNRELYRRFRHYLIQNTQLNGSFYKRMEVPAMATGMRWTEKKAPSRIHRTETALAPHAFNSPSIDEPPTGAA